MLQLKVIFIRKLDFKTKEINPKLFDTIQLILLI